MDSSSLLVLSSLTVEITGHWFQNLSTKEFKVIAVFPSTFHNVLTLEEQKRFESVLMHAFCKEFSQIVIDRNKGGT